MDLKGLVQKLEQASEAYYNDEPIISDAEFDELRDQLVSLNPNHPFLSSIGAKPSETGWPQHHHKNLMGSLEKVQTEEDFFKWASGKGDEFLLSEKYDGSTIVATYINGKLETLATRGNGKIGENITPNHTYIQNLPTNIPGDFSGEIRGEIILKISTFDKYFKPAGFSNPRNAANGKVRDMKDDPLKNHLEIRWFDVVPFKIDIKSEEAKWQLLAKLGLNPDKIEVLTASEIWSKFEEYQLIKRSNLDHEIDGLVVKVNNIDLQESFGVTNNRPKGAIALKFKSIEKVTKINDIVWNRGLTGVICPTAILEPVNIGGVTISKASLCGLDEIRRLDVAVGDEVFVSRRNDVIPKIERVKSRLTGRPQHNPPTHCDQCSEPLITEGAYLLCLNEECQGEIYGNLMTWIKELRIKGFGPSMVRALINEGISDISELYTSPAEVFRKAANSDSNGDRRYHALHDATKDLRLSVFLGALNIKSLGTTNGQRLEKHFKTLDNVLNSTVEEMQQIPGIKTNANKIISGLNKNKDLIQKMAQLIQIKSLNNSGPLAGKSFCITGDLSLPRPVIQDHIKSYGGEVKSGVSKGLDYLLTDNPHSGTGKNQKADKYGVNKITESELLKIIGIESWN